MREWKPGDVAAVTITKRNGGEATEYIAFYSGRYGWYGATDGKGVGGITDKEEYFEIDRRPLIVIDPEDREQVERLWAGWKRSGAYRTGGTQGEAVDSMQAALRSLIAPPKPEEPMGLGAVVEDAMGTKWVRHDSSAISCPWINTDDCQARYRKYDEINAVHILSDGVQP